MVFSFGALATGIVIIFSALAITTLACVAFQGIGVSGVLVRIRVAQTGTWGGTRHCTAARGCGARRVTASGKWGTVDTRGRQWRNVRSCIALCTGTVQRGLTCPKRRRPHRCGCQTGNRYLSGYCNRGEYIEKKHGETPNKHSAGVTNGVIVEKSF